jgi:hypothetical protein
LKLSSSKIAVFDWQPGSAPKPSTSPAPEAGITWVDIEEETPERALETIDPLELEGFEAQYLLHQFSNIAPNDPHADQALGSFDSDLATRLSSKNWPFLLQAQEPVFVEIGSVPNLERSLAVIRIGILAGDGWLITYRMRPIDVRFGGGYGLPTIRRERLAEAAEGFQRTDQTSIDVGMMMLEHLAKRSIRVAHEFRDEIGNRMIDLHRGAVEGSLDEGATARIRQELFDLRWVLDAFERSTRHFLADYDAMTERWYAAASDQSTALRVEGLYERALDDTVEARRTLAEAFAWLTNDDNRRVLTQQTEVQKELVDLQEGAANLQELVALLTVFVLVPTLMATLFGAMPSWWEGHQGVRSIVLIGVVIAAGAISWLLLQRRKRRGDVTYGAQGTPVYWLSNKLGIEINRPLGPSDDQEGSPRQ